MKNQWMKRRSVAALATGAVALAAFSGSQSGLLAGLFEKDRCELPKRVPCGDCSFGYSRTSWRPWEPAVKRRRFQSTCPAVVTRHSTGCRTRQSPPNRMTAHGSSSNRRHTTWVRQPVREHPLPILSDPLPERPRRQLIRGQVSCFLRKRLLSLRTFVRSKRQSSLGQAT